MRSQKSGRHSRRKTYHCSSIHVLLDTSSGCSLGIWFDILLSWRPPMVSAITKDVIAKLRIVRIWAFEKRLPILLDFLHGLKLLLRFRQPIPEAKLVPSENARKSPKHCSHMLPLTDIPSILQFCKHSFDCTTVFSVTSKPEMFRFDFIAAHIVGTAPCVSVLPFVILQDDSFPVEQMRGNEERYLPVSNVVADVLLPFFEGLESRYQIPKFFLQIHINGELSKEATKVLRCTVIAFSETGKSGSRIVIQFQSVISRFFLMGGIYHFSLSNHLPHGSPKSVRLILHQGCPSFQNTIPSITWVSR